MYLAKTVPQEIEGSDFDSRFWKKRFAFPITSCWLMSWNIDHHQFSVHWLIFHSERFFFFFLHATRIWRHITYAVLITIAILQDIYRQTDRPWPQAHPLWLLIQQLPKRKPKEQKKPMMILHHNLLHRQWCSPQAKIDGSANPFHPLSHMGWPFWPFLSTWWQEGLRCLPTVFSLPTIYIYDRFVSCTRHGWPWWIANDVTVLGILVTIHGPSPLCGAGCATIGFMPHTAVIIPLHCTKQPNCLLRLQIPKQKNHKNNNTCLRVILMESLAWVPWLLLLRMKSDSRSFILDWRRTWRVFVKCFTPHSFEIGACWEESTLPIDPPFIIFLLPSKNRRLSMYVLVGVLYLIDCNIYTISFGGPRWHEWMTSGGWRLMDRWRIIMVNAGSDESHRTKLVGGMIA